MRGYKTGKRTAAILLLCLLAFIVSGCGDKTAAYDKALALFAKGEYADAAAAFAKLGEFLQAETYAAYTQGLTYYEQGSYTAAEPYFEQTRDFMYGDQRYRFCHAYALEEAGAFAEAAAWYEALGEFEDSAYAAAYCAARAAAETGDYETALIRYGEAEGYQDSEVRLDAMNFEIYERATTLMDGKDYDRAFILFTLLGDRYGAAKYARTCKNYTLEEAYAAAEQMIKDGDLQGAYDQFSALAGYRDAASRADELAARLGIDVSAE
jgi:tetratricopeptide (TPR) repeat protein